jgi:NADH-quinone oxidoreductase subunit C
VPLSAPAALEETTNEIRAHLGDTAVDISENRGQLIVRVAAEHRAEALAVLKTLGFTFYVFCAGVDWPDDNRFEVLDHVYSIDRRVRVTVKCDIPRDNPRVETATTVYAGADWHERETWELFGIVFIGHPRLRRLLLPDWQEGFPMRKDYVLRARVEKPWPGEFFSG